ncbi:MAG: pyrroline-5-carboxylate reductase [Pseudomonadota bacterium]
MSVTRPPPLVGFIGAGNMARALAGGLINSGWDRSRLILSDPDAGQRDGIHTLLGLEVHADNAAVAARADILVFAVKPQALAVAAQALAAVAQQRRPLVVSVAAGVRIADLERWLGGNLPVVRVMPNTAVLVGAGACGMYANAHVSETMRSQAESILRAVGVAVWVEREELLDAVTALSGSGPAYFFLIMEALEQAAIAQGLSREAARLLTLQTAYGAAKMALEGSEEPAILRRHVTSPGGTTEQAIRVLEEGGLRKLFKDALTAAARRARELAELFGKGA